MLDENKPKMTPKDFFLYLSVLVTLYVSSIALITFLFTVINLAFPDRQDLYTNSTEAIAWSLSIFIVFYPVLIVLLSSARKGIVSNPLKANLNVRKWFIYLTLFVTGLTIAIDLIVLLNKFLSGDQITIAFILKVVVTFLVAGAIFWFSLKDLKGSFISNSRMFNLFRTITTTIVVALVIIGLVIMGSPQELRKQKDDLQRIQDLSITQSEIINFWQSKGRLPVTLDELNDPLSYFQTLSDPETGEDYGYNIISTKTFELCATFTTEGGDIDVRDKFNQGSFEHGIGETCFERTIDPDKFKPFPVPVIR